MIRSMTAFSREEYQTEWGILIWELRSVNHRYLEPLFRLPDSMRALEPKLREKLRQFCHRGKIECQLRLVATHQAHDSSPIQLDQPLANQVIQACLQLRSQLPEASLPSTLDLLRWPGVIIEDTVRVEEQKQLALTGFETALAHLVETRQREGQQLGRLISDRLDQLLQHTTSLDVAVVDLTKRYREILQDRIAEMAVQISEDRLAQEIAILAQKADIAEEIDRIKAHGQEVQRVIKQKGAIGRRLDFLMQELNREVNTLSAKSVDVQFNQSAVEMKVLIEQMREQVQNIE